MKWIKNTCLQCNPLRSGVCLSFYCFLALLRNRCYSFNYGIRGGSATFISICVFLSSFIFCFVFFVLILIFICILIFHSVFISIFICVCIFVLPAFAFQSAFHVYQHFQLRFRFCLHLHFAFNSYFFVTSKSKRRVKRHYKWRQNQNGEQNLIIRDVKIKTGSKTSLYVTSKSKWKAQIVIMGGWWQWRCPRERVIFLQVNYIPSYFSCYWSFSKYR